MQSHGLAHARLIALRPSQDCVLQQLVAVIVKLRCRNPSGIPSLYFPSPHLSTPRQCLKVSDYWHRKSGASVMLYCMTATSLCNWMGRRITGSLLAHAIPTFLLLPPLQTVGPFNDARSVAPGDPTPRVVKQVTNRTPRLRDIDRSTAHHPATPPLPQNRRQAKCRNKKITCPTDHTP